MVGRNRRKLRPFRPLPIDLGKRRRVTARQYARIYLNYESAQGKIKRLSFAVKVDPYKNRIVQYKLMKHLCSKLLRNQIPLCAQGYVFDDFGDLFVVTQWIRVRKVRRYEAGMVYAR